MKRRNGFVSNSSTSSFILIVKKDLFEENLPSELEEVFEDNIISKKIFGLDLVVINALDDSNGDIYINNRSFKRVIGDDGYHDEENCIYRKVEDLSHKLKEKDEDHIYIYTGD